MRKGMKVAVGLMMMATAVSAQLTQVQLTTQKMAPAEISMEQMKQNFEVMKAKGLPNKGMTLSQGFVSKSMKPMTGVIPGGKKVMTRAGEFGAYYEMPSGLYNIKTGFKYRTGLESTVDSMSRHGILAPLYQEIVFKNASTGTNEFDWYVNGTVVFTDSISVIYMPSLGGDFYEPMPELTAYAPDGNDSVYQYGYALNYETGEYTEGQAVTEGFGMVHNLDVNAESLYDTYLGSMTGYWSGMLFGSYTELKPSYFEIFEKPFHPVVLNSVYTFISTPVGSDLSSAEFSISVMEYDEVAGQWTLTANKVTGKPAGYLGSMEECDIWHMQLYFEKPILINRQFALVLDGPQDGSVGWAFLHQYNREASGKVTAGYIPSVGDYAGYMLPYASMPEGATEAVPYPTSIDLGLQMFTPYNILVDTESSSYLNYGGSYITITDAGLNANAVLWNWEAVVMGGSATMKITSDSDWLKAEITQKATNTDVRYKVNVTAEALPADMPARYGTLTFTDSYGYTSTVGIYQPNSDPDLIDNAILAPAQTELDLNAPIYDLTGRRVSNPTKGIYLQNGKKFVVE